MTNSTEIKHYDHVNGLGTISLSAELISEIFSTILKDHPKYVYKTHSITPITSNYYEVSVELELVSDDWSLKEIDKIQKELLLSLKQSLNLNCALFINIKHE